MAPMWTNKRRVSWSDIGYDLCMSRSRKRRRFNVYDSSRPCSHNKQEILGDAKRDLVRDADYSLYLKLLNVDDESGIEGSDDIDPDYKRFLDHLKVDEKSYIFEMKKEGCKFISIKYERWDEFLNETEKVKIPGCNSSLRKTRSTRDQDYCQFTPDNKHDMQSYPVDNEDYHPLSPGNKNDMESYVVDDSYELFLSKLKNNGEFMILEYDDVVVRYDCDDKGGTDSEVEPEYSPYCNHQKFHQSHSSDSLDSSMDEDDCNCIESLSGSHFSQYRERLMRSLRMPYSNQEYLELKRLACDNLRVVKTRELRGCLKSYPTEETGFSYLDHFDDFKQVLCSVRRPDRCSKRLNLLRGFFFYLQNLSHEGAFKPWLDTDCLKINAGSK